jgi:diguanylate cyclase (GGDEF)-like protein
MPVIMITGHDDTEAAKKATHSLGATDFLGKPFDKVDILSRAQSYTRLNKKITALEKEVAYDSQTGLYNNRLLIDFGTKTLSFGKRYNMVASILYAEISDIGDYREAYGDKAVDSIIHTVADHLERAVRKEELVSHIEETRFAIVLPNTKAFKAHIVATRLKQTVENLTFEIGHQTLNISIAIGISSSEDSDQSKDSSFEDCCVLASHALAASLETPNKRIIRYDETYEKKMSDEGDSPAITTSDVAEADDNAQDTHDFTTAKATSTVDDKQDSADAFTEFFSCILTGNYRTIPVEFLPLLIEPLENFLEYAHATINDEKQASAE